MSVVHSDNTELVLRCLFHPRVKRAVEKEKPATSIDITRCYGTLLAERSRPLEDPAKKLVKDCEDGGIENGGAVDTDVMLPPGVATIKSGDDRADCGGQVSRHLQYGRDIVSEERRRNAQKKPTHGTGNNVKRMSSTCTFEAKPSVDLGDTKWPLGDGDKQGLPTVRPINIYLGHANTKFKKVHLEQKKGDGEEFVSGLTMGDPERKGVANVAAFERKRGSRVVELVEKDSAIAMTKESTKDVLTWVGEDNHDDCPGGEEASPQQLPDGDDVLKSSNSDYGEDSFESTDETEESSATVASSTVPEDQISKTGVRAEKNVLINRDEDGDAHGARVYGARQCEASSRSGAITEEEGSRERAAAAAAALRIEACWRGFVCRRAAKWALRSILLNVLRNIGGGKISKVKHSQEKGRQFIDYHVSTIAWCVHCIRCTSRKSPEILFKTFGETIAQSGGSPACLPSVIVKLDPSRAACLMPEFIDMACWEKGGLTSRRGTGRSARAESCASFSNPAAASPPFTGISTHS